LTDAGIDPSRLAWEIVSKGEDEPISGLDRMNLRVAISLFKVPDRPAKPLVLEDILARLERLLSQPNALDKDVAKRMLCVVRKMRKGDADDRDANEGTVFYQLYRDGVYPHPGVWPTFRFQIIDGDRFGPQISDADVLKNLAGIDDDVVAGVVQMNQIIGRLTGGTPPDVFALSRAFKRWNAEFFERSARRTRRVSTIVTEKISVADFGVAGALA
jgi:hypothetical protein